MRVRRFVFGAVALCIICAAAWSLSHIAHTITLAAIYTAIRRTPLTGLCASALATTVSFMGLACYDRFATEVVAPARIGRGHAWFVGAISHAISNTLGIPVFTGSALRYRLYRQSGLETADIARVTIVVGLCVASGSVAVLVVALTFAPDAFAGGRIVGIGGAVVLLAMLAGFPWIARKLQRRGVALPAMRRRALLKPLAIGLIEGSAAIYALYALLPGDLRPGFATLAAIVLGAMLLGLLSHSPGGAGVFEAAVLTAFPAARHADVLAALLLFRLIYNLIPFAMAALLLTVQQARLAEASSIRGRI